jgi:hypothetical protein
MRQVKSRILITFDYRTIKTEIESAKMKMVVAFSFQITMLSSPGPSHLPSGFYYLGLYTVADYPTLSEKVYG